MSESDFFGSVKFRITNCFHRISFLMRLLKSVASLGVEFTKKDWVNSWNFLVLSCFIGITSFGMPW